ncbi:hypothetical protein Ancab_029133 [Ancistrocladus abbreviatus]
MASTSLPLHTPAASSTILRNRNPNTRKPYYHSLSCKAAGAASSSASSLSDFDLYDLLGIDSSCKQSQIKMAYRSLQKRCHPDIAGPPGHDMAIILNEAYAVLSDPNSRLAYDKEQAKTSQLRGYTGKPLYSAWFGSESEQRAVFVDEVKCVGCLKCALFAHKTFAIESVYGRARVVAQWADPEHKIQEAIDTCPVNCISIVERSDLAALEFLMSKQPRGNVRIGFGNTVGARIPDVLSEVEVFQKRFADAEKRYSSQHSKESDLQRNRRMSAIQAIRSISNWLYWQAPTSEACTTLTVTRLGVKSASEPNINKLRNAAEARKHGIAATSHSNYRSYNEEYWIPSTPVLPPGANNISIAPNTTSTEPPPVIIDDEEKYEKNYGKLEDQYKRSPLSLAIPVGNALLAAVIVELNGAQSTVGGLEEHLGGSFALEIVNSSWLRGILAGAAWYFVGLAIIQIVEIIRSSGKRE